MSAHALKIPNDITPNDFDIPMEQRKQFLQLNDGDCRFPIGTVGEADFFFCGAPAVPGKPYCATHCARAYVKSSR